MGAIIGLALGIAMLALKIIIKILVKLRLWPAALFVLITNMFFWDWAINIGDWFMVIVIALAAIGLCSFVVQGIIKLRKKREMDKKIEKAYVARMNAKFDQMQMNGEDLHKGGLFKIIN